MKKKQRKYKPKMTYGPFAELMADPVKPLPEAKRTYHLLKIYEGLDALDNMLHPEVHHWQSVADAANMLLTLTKDMDILEDRDGLIQDALAVLATAWERQEQGLPNELESLELTILRSMVNSYMNAIETLPERVMVIAHRRTEKRINKILQGARQEGDIVI